MSFIKKLLKSKKQTLNTDEIQQKMKTEKQKEPRTIGIMIAGALAVGKTTIYKQIKHIYDGNTDYPQSFDMEKCKYLIQHQPGSCMQILCRESKEIALKQEVEKIHMHNQFVVSGFIRQYQHKLPTYITFYIIPDLVVFICTKYFANTQVLPENEQLRNFFLEMPPYSYSVLNIDIANKIQKLWNDPGIKQTLLCSHKFQIPDNVKYWFEKVMDLAADDYFPSLRDYLTIRQSTAAHGTEVIPTDEFDSGTIWYFKFMDTSGRRSELKKLFQWRRIDAETVDLIIYVVALDDYNKKCWEAPLVNGLHESLMRFKKFCADNKWGEKIYIVFFNKYDLFKQKK
eukprot:458254_1